MNFLRKNFIKTCKIHTHLNPCSLSSPFSTNFSSSQQKFQAFSPMEKKELARPSEIPFQPKVANWVNFVGTVRTPVEFCTSVDGKSWASTIISQRQHFSALSSLWISVVFEGELAETAATHVKENHYIYVGGHLSGHRLPINMTNDQVTLQVNRQLLRYGKPPTCEDIQQVEDH
ncbi:protein OSB2, chloroplastic isoform X2 [Beta vulgaris subsp. vulgaris]|uniref:protein OSB2, chloroplastic isoform X2 n=1 Tax=Beta vulgaris subsp. vulgaris TaxID=3555 RepID=UPI000900B6A1|nr:protein OSB2, chloroplastic isoform X2 [Beta vulgaris subsp. vulgaris]